MRKGIIVVDVITMTDAESFLVGPDGPRQQIGGIPILFSSKLWIL